MLRPIALPFLCLAMFSIAGGPMALLQGVAWAGMLWDYSRDASIVEAAEKTFNGQYPCSMCVTITDARKQEAELPVVWKVDKKAEPILLGSYDSLLCPDFQTFRYPIVGNRLYLGTVFGPLTPPPRAV